MRLGQLSILLLLSLPAWGVDNDDHADDDHPVLVPDASLTLQRVVEITLARYPLAVELPARELQAQAWQDKGKSWISGQPLIAARYQSDRFNADEGLKEVEAGFEVPLWNWGQRAATRDLGAAFTSESGAAAAALALVVAAKVRNLLWDFRLAESNLQLAQQALATAQKRSAALQRRYELGDISLADTVLAKTEALDRQTQQVEAEAGFVDASRMYFSIAGTQAYPLNFEEEQSTRTDVVDTHPLLVLARSSVDRADAERSYQLLGQRDNPSVKVGPRSEQPSALQESQSSIGIQVEIPFGGGSHTRAATAGSERQFAGTQAVLMQVQRELDIGMHEAEHELFVVREKEALAQARLDLITQHLAMGESAFEKGELDLLALLLLQTNADTAIREAASLAIEVQRAIATYNQAVGEMP